MPAGLVIYSTLLLAATPATSAETANVFVSEIQSADIRPHVEFLAGPELKGRSGADSRRAADYIAAHFRHCQLRPLFGPNEFFQSIPGVPEVGGPSVEIGRNVGAVCEGSDPALKDECVIIGVHYDHLGVRDGQTFAGADDNATGVAMMLELARLVSQMETKPQRSLVFVGFDLEERMLWGSRWFASHSPWPLERVKLFLTADMIGRSLGDLPLPAVFVLGSEHAPQLKRTLDRVGQPQGLEVARLGIDLVGTRSDYGPFRDRKVPFLFFSTGEHPDYHTPRDVPAKVDFDKASRVSGLAWKLVQDVANTAEPPIWTDAVTGDLDEPRALERITTLLLEAESEQRPLTDVQRYMVSTVRNRTRRILEQGTMTADDRTWLIRMSQLLLLSVF